MKQVLDAFINGNNWRLIVHRKLLNIIAELKFSVKSRRFVSIINHRDDYVHET